LNFSLNKDFATINLSGFHVNNTLAELSTQITRFLYKRHTFWLQPLCLLLTFSQTQPKMFLRYCWTKYPNYTFFL